MNLEFWSIKLLALSCLLLIFFNDGEAFPTNDVKQPKSDTCCDCDKLTFAHVIFRHGQRNIIEPCPNDPYKDEAHWPGGFGQLTNEGKRQEYKLGQYLRKRYDEIIGSNYSPDTLYVKSTDFDRTIMSALTNLAGLYPPKGHDVWNEDIPWIPIPIHTTPVEDDYVLHGPHGCAKYHALFEKHLKESPEVQETLIQNGYLFSHWSKLCGREISTIQGASYFYNGLSVEIEQNKMLGEQEQIAIRPNGTLENISKHYFKLAAATPQLARLQSGFLLKEILEHFTKKIDSQLQPNRTLWLYSGHDLTISYMLQSLGLFEPHFPNYASSLHFELYQTEGGKHYFQLFYRNSEEETLSPMDIPNCGEKCDLDKFYAEYSEIIPGNYADECRLD